MAAWLSEMWSPFRERRFWVLVGMIFLGRMAWFAYWGVLLEIDSLGYLDLQTTLYHPPGYMVFNALIFKLVNALEAVVLAQSLLYSLAAALFLRAWVTAPRWRLGLAVTLALEPMSGKLACTIMAETLFLSLILLALASLPRLLEAAPRRRVLGAAALGLLLALAYLTRYAAPVFGVAIVLWLLLQKLPLRRLSLMVLVMLVAFQFAILPLRMYYQSKFGTLQFNAFSSLSLWNSAAYLYPGSAAENEVGSTDFQTFLQTMPAEKFALYETWHTNQIFHDSCAFQRYVRGLPTQAAMGAAADAGALGRRLLAGAPLRHLREFVLPNIGRPFTISDVIYADRLAPLVRQGLHYQRFQVHAYARSWWWICFGLLLVATGLGIWRRKQAPAVLGLLLLCCWLYLAGIAVLTVVFLRFVFVLGPLVVLAFGMGVKGFFGRGTELES